MMAFFDIETAPQQAHQIAHLMPEFSAPANYKDPEKILSYINSSKSKWLEESALSAMTGVVLCVGVLRPVAVTAHQHVFELIEGSETDILETIWGMYSTGEFDLVPWVGFNSKGFDLPFLIQRSWHLRVPIPENLFRGRFLSERMIDLMECFSCFQRGNVVSLDRVSKFLGTGEKTGSGAEFHKLWVSDKPKAIEYLRNDLALIQRASEVMGVETWAPRKVVNSSVRLEREPLALTV